MPHLRPKEEKKNLLWLLSMPSPQLKPYKGGIVCVPLLRALVVTGRGLWLGRVVDTWETLGKGARFEALGLGGRVCEETHGIPRGDGKGDKMD